ncbi:utrophin-like isoform X2 [Xenia sp. Carnegie-2017]|nr:utrophin-like isoform X2 [Xenia sp. Carnegie-2017]
MNIRTYTKWINSKLPKTHPPVKDLIEDLQDGRVLIALLEVLLKKKIQADKGNLRFHKLNNVSKVLTLLKDAGLKLHFIHNEAIVDGNKTSILGLLWMIILHFQVQGIMFDEEEGQSDDKPSPQKKSNLSQTDVEKMLLKWAQDVLRGFSDLVPINDITKSWHDGLAFVFLLFVFRPNAVDINGAQKMSVPKRLEYAFDIANKEFGVPSLLDPSDIEEGNVDKNGMLMYLSTLYEVLRNHEPEVENMPAAVEVKRTSLIIEDEPGSSRLRVGDDVIDIKIVSTNEIVLRHKKLYYTVLYTVKALEERMKKIQEEDPSQQSAKELREVQIEMQELQKKVKELNETNQEMSKSQGVDPNEFSEIQNELKELSGRWSVLVQQSNEEIKRQPTIVREIRTRRTVQSCRLTIGEEVIDITSVSSNEIVIRYKIVYYEIITIIKLIEKNMKIIEEEEPSQKTAALLDENIQRMDHLEEKITELNNLMSEMKDAENVDPEELEELQNDFKDFESRRTHVNNFISTEKERQPVLTTKTVYTTTRQELTSQTPDATATTTSLNIDGEVISIKTVSTNEIVIQYKTIYYTILYKIKRLEERLEEIQKQDPSQENAKKLREVQMEMQELQKKVKELNETNQEMSKAQGVDPKEFSEIQNEIKELSGRWSTLAEQSNEEIKRQPTIVREIRTTRTVQSCRLTIGEEVIDITSVSSNEIVIRYKIVYYEIITIIKLIEKNMKIIEEEEPSQKTAALLDENIQRMDHLEEKITELNNLMSEMKDAENVDPEELEELQNDFKDFESRRTHVNNFISTEKERQPVLTTETVYTTTRQEVTSQTPHATATTTSLNIDGEVISIKQFRPMKLSYNTKPFTIPSYTKSRDWRRDWKRSKKRIQVRKTLRS